MDRDRAIVAIIIVIVVIIIIVWLPHKKCHAHKLGDEGFHTKVVMTTFVWKYCTQKLS